MTSTCVHSMVTFQPVEVSLLLIELVHLHLRLKNKSMSIQLVLWEVNGETGDVKTNGKIFL